MKKYLIVLFLFIICALFCGCDRKIKEYERRYEAAVYEKDYYEIKDVAGELALIYNRKYNDSKRDKINYYKWKKIKKEAEIAINIANSKEIYIKNLEKENKSGMHSDATRIAREYKELKDYDNYIKWMDRANDFMWEKGRLR